MNGLEGANATRLDIQRLRTIPAMPLVARRVRTAAASGSLTVLKLASILKQDPAMSARILSLANAPFFGTAGRIKTIEDAVQRVLGLEMSRSLALSLALNGPLDVAECRIFRPDRYWASAMMTGALASKLVRHVSIDPLPSPKLVFLCGLLHNLGLLALVSCYPAQMAHVLANAQTGLVDAQRDLLGTDHHRAGGWLARRWGLPPEIVDVIEHHHERERLHHWDLARLVGYCARWAESWLAGQDEPPDEPDTLDALSLTSEQLEDTFKRCEAIFRQIDRFAGRIDK